LPQLKDINIDFVMPVDAVEAQVESAVTNVLVDGEGNLTSTEEA
jgi:hypothetical protein